MFEVDPTSPGFDFNGLTGAEHLLCPDCKTTFGLDYAEALANNDTSMPQQECCRKMLKTFLRLRFKSFADNMVVSDEPILRKAGVELRNVIAKLEEKDEK